MKQLKEDPSGEKSTLLNASVTENVLPPAVIDFAPKNTEPSALMSQCIKILNESSATWK